MRAGGAVFQPTKKKKKTTESTERHGTQLPAASIQELWYSGSGQEAKSGESSLYICCHLKNICALRLIYALVMVGKWVESGWKMGGNGRQWAECTRGIQLQMANNVGAASVEMADCRESN